MSRRTRHGAVIGPHRGRRARRRFPTWQFDPVRRALHRVMRQRVQRQCCTRGRPRPAHPRQLAGMRMRDAPARRFVCVRCHAPVLVCSRCDRGQIYCAAGCSATARRQSQRDAGRRYQDSLPGRFHHAARTQRWRVRQAALTASTPMPAATQVAPCAAQSVTHQGSPSGGSDAVLATPSSMPAAAAAPAPASHDQPCTTVTTTTTTTTTSSSACAPATPACAVAGTPPADHPADHLADLALPLVPNTLRSTRAAGLPAPQQACTPCPPQGGAQPWP